MVTGGSGINVTGSGTGADPYVVDATASSITGTIRVSDTATIDLTLDGSGSVTDPYDISAQATVSVGDLEDVATGNPAAGDTLLWDGEQWIYGPPSSGGGGATVATGNGIDGDGSVTDPVVLATSGVWGQAPLDRYGANTLLGAPIYVDSAGQARSQPMGVQVLTAGQPRPDQYPGRIIIEDGEPFYSTGSQWFPLAAPTFTDETLLGAGESDDPLRAAAKIITGSVSVPETGSGDGRNVSVTFPSGGFGSAPKITTNPVTTAPHQRALSAMSATPSGFMLRYVNTGSSAIGVSAQWVAVEVREEPALAALTADDKTSSWGTPAQLAMSVTAQQEPDATVTCPTPGCYNRGVSIPVITSWYDLEMGEVMTVDTFMCGVCDTDITDTLVPFGPPLDPDPSP